MWSRYVERKLLTTQVAKLEADVRERDALDAQIETCVGSMFERMRVLEATNDQLVAAIQAQGGEVPPLPAMPELA